MYVYVSSADSKTIYPNNSAEEFIVELPHAIQDYTKIAVTYVHFRGRPSTYYYIFCDAIESSVIKGNTLPVLGSFFESGSISNPAYVKISREEVQRLRLVVKPADSSVKPLTGEIYFTLHLV